MTLRGSKGKHHVEVPNPTPEERQIILSMLAQGWPFESACASAGFLAWQGRVWLLRSIHEPQNEACRGFDKDVQIAREKGFIYLAADIKNHGKDRKIHIETTDHQGNKTTRIEERIGDWKAKAWVAERMNPRMRPRVQVAVESEVSAILDAIERVVDAATYERILEAVSETRERGPALTLPDET